LLPLTHARGTEKTDHPYKIQITQRSNIHEVTSQQNHSPYFAYNAKLFEVLETHTGDNTVLSGLTLLHIQSIVSTTHFVPSIFFLSLVLTDFFTQLY
jgi:hypothetical protein